MSHFQLGARDRKTAFIGGIAVAAMLGLSRGVPALRAWDERERARVTAIAEELAASRSARRDLPSLVDSLRARLSRRDQLDSTLIVADSPSDGAAMLASTLEDLADGAEFRITGLQVRADSTITLGMARVGIRLTGVTDVRGLSEMIRAIEGDERPLLVIRDLTVVQQDPAAPSSKAEALRVDLSIDALCVMRRGGRA